MQTQSRAPSSWLRAHTVGSVEAEGLLHLRFAL